MLYYDTSSIRNSQIAVHPAKDGGCLQIAGKACSPNGRFYLDVFACGVFVTSKNVPEAPARARQRRPRGRRAQRSVERSGRAHDQRSGRARSRSHLLSEVILPVSSGMEARATRGRALCTFLHLFETRIRLADNDIFNLQFVQGPNLFGNFFEVNTSGSEGSDSSDLIHGQGLSSCFHYPSIKIIILP